MRHELRSANRVRSGAVLCLLALLPAGTLARDFEPAPVPVPSGTAAPQESAVQPLRMFELGGALAWTWRGEGAPRPIAMPSTLLDAEPLTADHAAAVRRSALRDVAEEGEADQGRLLHGGNLLRIEF